MWTPIDVQPSVPFRAGHTALCTPYKPSNLGNDCVWLFGGGDNDGAFFGDLINLSVPKHSKNTDDNSEDILHDKHSNLEKGSENQV